MHIPYYAILAVFVLRFFISLVREARFRRYAAIPIWTLTYALAYGALGVPYYYLWYYIPVIVGVYSMAALGSVEWARDLADSSKKHLWARRAAAAALLIYPWVMLGRTARDPHIEERRKQTAEYRRIASFIEANVPPTASIAAVEIGVLGYEVPNPIVDLAGIVDPEVASHIREQDLDWVFQHRAPDYVLVHHKPLAPEAPAVIGAFKDRYRIVRRVTETQGRSESVSLLELIE